jgi:hypothetical protein
MTSYMQPDRQDRIMVKLGGYITDYTANFMSNVDIIFCIILQMESTCNKKRPQENGGSNDHTL